MRHFLFLLATAREAGADGNTERLARAAAATLPPGTVQTWLRLADFRFEPFVDQRHTVGTYPPPTGDLARLLEATLACTDLVLVSPVYWYSFPAALKAYLDQWSAWLRVPGLNFRQVMGAKRLHLIVTGGDRAKAQPMIDSARLCAEFFPMPFAGVLFGQGGAPGAIEQDAAALAAAATYLTESPEAAA
ncbi:MAG: NAD(P)H-dependent oxidoreductase [Verrucomicrobia bacterium]|nr:NAD(P)H-dependent oxidoreductase [Verrucomicrobiota bacterium]